jgi:hypothetical protein
MPIHVHTIDASSNDNGQLARARNNHPQALLTRNVADLIRAILSRIGEDRIELLDIVGHGHSGQINVGGGVRPTAEQVIAVDDWYQLYNADLLGMLCGRFAPDAVVRLHACGLARGMRGEILLFKLAQLWRVRVQGALVTQFPDRADRFEGRYYTEANGTAENLEPMATRRNQN